MRTVEEIQEIQSLYQRLGPGRQHTVVMQEFDLIPGQEYAINIFGRNHNVPAEILAEKLDSIIEGMTIGDIAQLLGFPAEAALNSTLKR